MTEDAHNLFCSSRCVNVEKWKCHGTNLCLVGNTQRMKQSVNNFFSRTSTAKLCRMPDYTSINRSPMWAWKSIVSSMQSSSCVVTWE